MQSITISIVTYNNKKELLQKSINSTLNTLLPIKLYIIDNSSTPEIESICTDKRIEYIFNNKNVGFGAGHNIAIRKSLGRSKYHLVLNPDVFFEQGVLEKLFNFMETNSQVGIVAPRICYFDGSMQYVCKLLPTPLDSIARTLRITKILFKNRFERYELKFTNYNTIMDVPHLSGCFMLIRQEVFKKVGMFDERFFLYLEDVDYSRRVLKYFRNVYNPEVVVCHKYAKQSYINIAAFIHHASSAIKYFNKWGWFFDTERAKINSKTLKIINTNI